MVYKGPDVGRVIANGLVERLKREGYFNISEAVGAAA
jgi:hypothetical protein